jgi:hypothetical protein
LRWEVLLVREGPPSEAVKPRSVGSPKIWGWVRLALDRRFLKRGGNGAKAPIVDEG